MSTAMIPIVEVIGPAQQGLSRPLLCVGADDQRYYVKGQQTNRASLWSEWICAHLAQALGLPLPPFSLVQLDPALVRSGRLGDKKITVTAPDRAGRLADPRTLVAGAASGMGRCGRARRLCGVRDGQGPRLGRGAGSRADDGRHSEWFELKWN